MTFPEVVERLMQRPEMVALSPLGQVIKLSPSGFLVPAFKNNRSYCRFRAQEVTGIMWTIYTVEQLAAMDFPEAQASS